jgi:hypothetical protein
MWYETVLCAYLGFLNKVLSYTKIIRVRFRIITGFFFSFYGFFGFVSLSRGIKDLNIHHFLKDSIALH